MHHKVKEMHKSGNNGYKHGDKQTTLVINILQVNKTYKILL